MEKQFFERDYRVDEAEVLRSGGSEFFGQLTQKGFFKEMAAYIDAIPKHVSEEGRQTYEQLLAKCDEMAKQGGGQVKGVISEGPGSASIQVTLPAFEFTDSEEMALINEITSKASSIAFYLGDDKCIRMRLDIEYFVDDITQQEYSDSFGEILQCTMGPAYKSELENKKDQL